MKKEITLIKNGISYSARRASQTQLNEVKELFAQKGLDINECSCGTEVCHNGFIWICTSDLEDRCQWLISDWKCN
jgi:hypothetical protein